MDLVTCEAPLDNSFQKDRRELVNKGSLGRRRKPSRSNLRHILSPSTDQQDVVGFSSCQKTESSYIKENGISNGRHRETSTSHLNCHQEVVKTDQIHSRRSINNHLHSVKSNSPLTEASKNYREVIASINQLCNAKSTDFNGNNRQSIFVSRASEDIVSSFDQDVINSNVQRTKTENNVSYSCSLRNSGIKNHKVVTSNNQQDRTPIKYNNHNKRSNSYHSSIAVNGQTTESRNNFRTKNNHNQYQTVASRNQQNVVTFSNHRQIVTSTPIPCKNPVFLNGRRQERISPQGSTKLHIESSLPRTSDETNLVADAQQFSIEAKLKRKKSENQGRSAVLIQTWERRTQYEPFSKPRKDCNTPIKNLFCDKENTDANSNAMPDSYICTKYKGSLQNGDHLKEGELVPNVRDINPDDAMLYRVSEDRHRRTQVSGTASGEVTVNGKSAVEEPEWISLSRKLCAKYVDEHTEQHSPDSYPQEEPEGVGEEPLPSHQPKMNSSNTPVAQRDVPKKQIVVVTPGVDGSSPTNEPPWIHLSRKLCNKFIEEHIEYPPITNGHFVEVPEFVEPNGDVRIIEKIGKPKGRKSKLKNECVPEWVSLSKKLRAKFIESHIDDPDTIAMDNQLNASDPEETGSESMSDVSQDIAVNENVRKHPVAHDYREFINQSQERKVGTTLYERVNQHGNNREGYELDRRYENKNSTAFSEKECCWEYQEMEFDQESNSGTFQEVEYIDEPLQEVRIRRGSIPEDSLEPTASSFEKFCNTYQTPECYNNDVQFAPRSNNDVKSAHRFNQEVPYTACKGNVSTSNWRDQVPSHDFSKISEANRIGKSSSSNNKTVSPSCRKKNTSPNNWKDCTVSNNNKDRYSVNNYKEESPYTRKDKSCKNWKDGSLYTRVDESFSSREDESSSDWKDEHQCRQGKNESYSYQKDESSSKWNDESQSNRWKDESQSSSYKDESQSNKWKDESQSDKWKDESQSNKWKGESFRSTKSETDSNKWQEEPSSCQKDEAHSTHWNDVASSKSGQQNKLITVQFIAHENNDRKTGLDKENYARRYKEDQKHNSYFNLSTWEEAHFKDVITDGQRNSEKGSLSKEFKSKSLDNLCDSLDERLVINIKQSCKSERRNSLNSAIPEENSKFQMKESLNEQNSDVFLHEYKQNSNNSSDISSIKGNINGQLLESDTVYFESNKTSPRRPHNQEKKQNRLSKSCEIDTSSDDEVFDIEPKITKRASPVSEETRYGKINTRKSPVSENLSGDKKQLNNEKVKKESSSKNDKSYKCNGMIPNSIYSGLPENKDSFSKYHEEEKSVQNGYKEPTKLGMSKWITMSKSEQSMNKNEYSNVQSHIQREQRNHSKSPKSVSNTKQNKPGKMNSFGEKYVNERQEDRSSKGSSSPKSISSENKRRISSAFKEKDEYSHRLDGSVKEFDLKHKCKSFCDISYNSNTLRDESNFRHHESVADISSAAKAKKSTQIEFQHFDFDSEIPLCAKLVSNQDKKKSKKVPSATSSIRAESPCPSESSHVYEDMFKETPSGPSSEASSWVMKNNTYYVNGRSSSMNDLDYSDSCSMSVKCDYASSSENSTLQSRHSSYASSSFYVNLRDYDSHMLEPTLNKAKKGNPKVANNGNSSISKSNPPTPESLRHLFTSPLSSIHSPAGRNPRMINRIPSDPQSHYYSTVAATSSAFKHGFAVNPPKPKKTERSSSIKIKDIAQGIILTFKRFQNHSKNSNVSPTHYVDVSHLAEMNGNSDAGKSKKSQKDSKGKQAQDKNTLTENGKTDSDSGFLSDVQRAKARRSSSDLTGMRSNSEFFNQDKKKSKSSKKNSSREKGKKSRSKASEPRTIPTVSRKVQQMADGTLYLVTTVSGDTSLPGVYSDSPDTSSELSCHKPVKQSSESNC